MADAADHQAEHDEHGGRQSAALGTRLDGWKAIAGHLGRDIRTVQRWELSEGLPVHRLGHKQRATAYAFAGELDEWLAKRAPADSDASLPSPVPASRPRTWRIVALVLSLAGVVVAAILVVLTVGNRENQAGDTQIPEAYAAFAE